MRGPASEIHYVLGHRLVRPMAATGPCFSHGDEADGTRQTQRKGVTRYYLIETENKPIRFQVSNTFGIVIEQSTPFPLHRGSLPHHRKITMDEGLATKGLMLELHRFLRH